MATRQYIGARYVIKIYQNSQSAGSAEWEANVNYEPLVLVTYNYGSYLSKKQVPATIGNPVDNPTYWVQTGFYNGQIASLQDQIDNLNNTVIPAMQEEIEALENITANKKYVLIGDSFGVGIQGGSQAWSDDGWMYYFDRKHDDVFYYDPQHDATFEGASGFTTVSQKNFLGQLNYVYENKLGDTDPDYITDIIVLGGTNDIGASEAEIKAAIDTFFNRAATLFPNAKVSIGVWGLNGRAMVNTSHVYVAYKKETVKNDGRFLGDALMLGCNPTYDSGYGHFSLAGYTLYAPYIEELIVNGKIDYNYMYTYNLTLDAGAVLPQYSFTYAIVFYVNKHGVKARLIDAVRYTPVIVQTVSKLTDVTRDANIFDFAADAPFYFPFNETTPIAEADVYYCDGNPSYIPATKANVFIKNSSGFKVSITSGYPNFYLASIINDATYNSFVAFGGVSPAVSYIDNDV